MIASEVFVGHRISPSMYSLFKTFYPFCYALLVFIVKYFKCTDKKREQ